MRLKRWRSSQPTAGWSATARITPMSTHRRMVRIWERNSMRPTIASTVSVTMAVTRMIWDALHSLRSVSMPRGAGSNPATASPPPVRPAADCVPESVSLGGAGAASRAAPHGPIAQLVRAADS